MAVEKRYYSSDVVDSRAQVYSQLPDAGLTIAGMNLSTTDLLLIGGVIIVLLVIKRL